MAPYTTSAWYIFDGQSKLRRYNLTTLRLIDIPFNIPYGGIGGRLDIFQDKIYFYDHNLHTKTDGGIGYPAVYIYRHDKYTYAYEATIEVWSNVSGSTEASNTCWDLKTDGANFYINFQNTVGGAHRLIKCPFAGGKATSSTKYGSSATTPSRDLAIDTKYVYAYLRGATLFSTMIKRPKSDLTDASRDFTYVTQESLTTSMGVNDEKLFFYSYSVGKWAAGRPVVVKTSTLSEQDLVIQQLPSGDNQIDQMGCMDVNAIYFRMIGTGGGLVKRSQINLGQLAINNNIAGEVPSIGQYNGIIDNWYSALFPDATPISYVAGAGKGGGGGAGGKARRRLIKNQSYGDI